MEKIVGYLMFLSLGYLAMPLAYFQQLINNIDNKGFEVFVSAIIGFVAPVFTKVIREVLQLSGTQTFFANFALSVITGVVLTWYWFGLDIFSLSSAQNILVILGASNTAFESVRRLVTSSQEK